MADVACDSSISVEVDPFFFSRERLLELFDNYEPPKSIKECPLFMDRGLWPELKMESFVREHNPNRIENDQTQKNNHRGAPNNRYNRRGDWQNRDHGHDENWDDANADSGYFDADGRYVAAKSATTARPEPVILKDSSFSADDWVKMKAAKIWAYTDVNLNKQGPFSTTRMYTWFNQNLLPMELPIGLDQTKDGIPIVYEELSSYFSGGVPFETFSQEAMLLMAKRADVSLPEDYVKQQQKIVESNAAAAAPVPVPAPAAATSAPKPVAKGWNKPAETVPAATPATTATHAAPAQEKHVSKPAHSNTKHENQHQQSTTATTTTTTTNATTQQNAPHHPKQQTTVAAKKEEKKYAAPAWGTPLAPSAEAFEGPKKKAEEENGTASTSKFDMNMLKTWQSLQKIELDMEVVDFLCTLSDKDEFLATVTTSLPSVSRIAAEELRRILFRLPLPKGQDKLSAPKHVVPAVAATANKQSTEWQSVKGGAKKK
eukprot:GDKJ01023731.1.p1 GENE.GDKJ01023731.1~~GDKJ01023731.1.p1  ORF type:complete len:487 (-),score=172.06 GDKJ01023731.1:153-1613(-)